MRRLYSSHPFFKFIGKWLMILASAALFTGSIGVFGDIGPILTWIATHWGITLTNGQLAWFFAALVGIGALLYGLGVLFESIEKRRVTVLVRPCESMEDIRQLYLQLDNYAQTGLVPMDIRVAMMEKNPNCFHIAEVRKFDGSREVVGLIMLFFLNKASVDRVERGEMTGYDVRAQHIVVGSGRPSGCYIGFVWGADHSAIYKRYCAEVLRAANRVVRRAAKGQKEFKVFGRPTTYFAINAMRRRGFVGLDGRTASVDYDQICMRVLKSTTA